MGSKLCEQAGDKPTVQRRPRWIAPILLVLMALTKLHQIDLANVLLHRFIRSKVAYYHTLNSHSRGRKQVRLGTQSTYFMRGNESPQIDTNYPRDRIGQWLSQLKHFTLLYHKQFSISRSQEGKYSRQWLSVIFLNP